MGEVWGGTGLDGSVGATAPTAGHSGSLVPRLDELLAGALQRLVAETRAGFAAAWSHEGARLAHAGDLPRAVPSGAAFEAIYAAEGAVDLGGVSGWACGVALSASEPIAAICVGPSPARPRTLAALNSFAERLRAPAATAVSLERLQRAEAEMMRVARLATMGDLLAEAVHEIRNPLVAVKAFLQLLPENRDDPDFTENFRNGVIDEVRRMERLLDAILQQVRPQARAADAAEAAEAAPTSLGAVIESVGRLLEKRAQEKRLKLVVDVGADLPPAAIDEDSLRQIVLNLALNALEVTPEHGRVALTATSGAGVLELLVDDEGPGIPDAERERVFEPFYSTRIDRPIGLGLAVCRRLALAAGGSIHAAEAPRGGARLCVRLPLA